MSIFTRAPSPLLNRRSAITTKTESSFGGASQLGEGVSGSAIRYRLENADRDSSLWGTAHSRRLLRGFDRGEGDSSNSKQTNSSSSIRSKFAKSWSAPIKREEPSKQEPKQDYRQEPRLETSSSTTRILSEEKDRSAKSLETSRKKSDSEVDGKHKVSGSKSQRRAGKITIHVFDEGRNLQQDFTCGLQDLLSGMKYFRDYLSDVNNEEVEMSVHCDVVVFAWLLKYIQGRPRTPLEVSNCVPILISSDFLKMDGLIEECIRFITCHLMEVTALPIDLSCLAEPMLLRMALHAPEEALERVRAFQIPLSGTGDKSGADDRASASNNARQMLVSKLYRLKLEHLIQKHQGVVGRQHGSMGSGPPQVLSWCMHCSSLYASAAHNSLVCPQARILVTSSGEVIARHAATRKWEDRRYLQALRSQRHTWREIYWHVWGVLHVLHCKRCNLFFPVGLIDHCCFHPGDAAFNTGANEGLFVCCRRQAFRFDSTQTQSHHAQRGCQARSHDVELDQDLPFSVLLNPLEDSEAKECPTKGAKGDHNKANPTSPSTPASEKGQVELVLSLLERHRNLVAVPFPNPASSPQSLSASGAAPPSPSSSLLKTTATSSPRKSDSQSGDMPRPSENRILTRGSLREVLLAGLDPTAGVDDEDEDEDEDEDDDIRRAREMEDRRRSEFGSSSSGSEAEPAQTIPERVGGKKRAGRRKGRVDPRAQIPWNARLPSSQTLQEMPPRLQKALRQDALRTDEESRLESLMYSLDTGRKDTPAAEELKSKAKASTTSGQAGHRSRPGSAKSLPITRVARDALRSRSSRWSQLNGKR